MELSEALAILEKSGTAIDPIIKDFAQKEEWKRKHIKEVWECVSAHKRRYLSEVHMSGAFCPCGSAMKRVWRESTDA